MHGDDDYCPHCGVSAKYAWDGSNYETIPDGLEEEAYYTCVECKKKFKIHTEYRIVKKFISKYEQKKEDDEDA